MSSFIHLVCDYASGDLAWAEIMAALSCKLHDDTRIHTTSVMPFDTVATGFIVAQLALSARELRPKNLLVFANCAPRKDKKDARPGNEGEGLLFATLKNGVQVVAVNSGYSLSFVRDQVQEVWSTNVEEAGSQFRSRDFFPLAVSKASRGDFSFRNKKLAVLDVVPEPPSSVIGYIDSFGNIKTTIRAGDPLVSELVAGTRLKVTIGSHMSTATVASGSFNIMEGDLAFAPGSSGHENRFWELFKRGGSAADEFGHPAPGSPIKIQTV
ncbi:MAG: SAM-dependent chlorinase/fluorinase [Candidatus Obscuribacter sp.]|jgi:S-adenosylmethionine hydrolase|nr:SAM-dependent chlorinase/fluorinase [Candidatus Obscuribacter sp.]MDQ5965664.1 SAM-dependent chlorinase/fluorinase [Cyanobacteriota bacterium erpe_2018_sw_39hr_WHONDRS-SW48-000098_B_bin.30]MBL0187308.1 SAM-dependent chlorinase/fluorinase [Candidatus Obscuribacter sp.]MBP6351292.1 SAM-dependent chlorinase/fluorinase [Candidatus Obscuribacter sp.]MBP6595081.1 SAM-dependent chlorinase/fluorinase [Candidatus Obscuribacter sp.]